MLVEITKNRFDIEITVLEIVKLNSRFNLYFKGLMTGNTNEAEIIINGNYHWTECASEI